MSAAGKRRTKRKRRASRAALKHGPTAKPTHKLPAGRTGGVHAKKTPAKAAEDKRCELLVDYDGRCYDDDCPVHGAPAGAT